MNKFLIFDWYGKIENIKSCVNEKYKISLKDIEEYCNDNHFKYVNYFYHEEILKK